MIQLGNLEELKASDIGKLTTLILPELQKRKDLYLRYKRKEDDSNLIHKHSGNGVVPFEKYIVDIASGYLGGKAPKYIVCNTTDKDKQTIIKKVLNKLIGNEKAQKEMEVLIDYITKYNDDDLEHYSLVKDILMVGACYEIIYENEENEVVYSRLDPLQTIAIWDYNVPRNIIGLVRYYNEYDINNKQIEIVELIDKTGTRKFKTNGIAGTFYEEESVEELNNHYFGDTPCIVVEQEQGISLFEPVIDLIEQYEKLVQNTCNTFQYNDEAKLKITGYMPTEPLMIEDKNGNLIENEKRKKEDETLLKAKVFYTPDNSGDISWVEKTINDGATQNTLKTLIDLILMNTGVPNITDLGFTKADNASAIDRKFFTLEQMTIDTITQLKLAYKRRWELIFNRINLENGTTYDFRDVRIDLQKNLPANEVEVVDSWMKLRGLVSDGTIIDHLPYSLDSITELKKLDEQEETNFDKEITRQTTLNQLNSENEDIEE